MREPIVINPDLELAFNRVVEVFAENADMTDNQQEIQIATMLGAMRLAMVSERLTKDMCERMCIMLEARGMSDVRHPRLNPTPH